MGSANKKYKVIISEKAADMLIQHVRFLAKVSEQAANRLREEIIQATKSLHSFPESNSWLSVTGLPAYKYRKMVTGMRYLIIYQIKDDTVYVEYIIDCRQDYQWLL